MIGQTRALYQEVRVPRLTRRWPEFRYPTAWRRHRGSAAGQASNDTRQGATAADCDSRGKRVRKTLPTAYAARAFYSRMDKASRQPRVVYKQQAG